MGQHRRQQGSSAAASSRDDTALCAQALGLHDMLCIACVATSRSQEQVPGQELRPCACSGLEGCGVVDYSCQPNEAGRGERQPAQPSPPLVPRPVQGRPLLPPVMLLMVLI